jgi:hypothetical protein
MVDVMERGADISPCGLYRYDLWRKWSQLVDDGDAFRLAVLIGVDKTLVLTIGCGGAKCEIPRPKHVSSFEQHSKHDYDQLAATRIAIVRCAAEIGKKMG